jgi:uncharacterized protein YggE
MIKSPHKIVIILALLNVLVASAEPTEHIISVQGVGEVALANTEGRIQASVTTLNADADVALSTNSAIVANIISELDGVGIKTEDISTSRFDFHPQYDWNNGQQIFQGYSVTNGLNIVVQEVSAVGAVLNLLVDAGATRINSVGFGSSSLSEVRTQALQRASEDALAKASILAAANGVTLGEVIQVRLSSANTVLESTAIGAVSSSPAPIVPGTNTYRETVHVTYALIE